MEGRVNMAYAQEFKAENQEQNNTKVEILNVP
jgi:hypothetical protein